MALAEVAMKDPCPVGLPRKIDSGSCRHVYSVLYSFNLGTGS